MIDNWTGTAPSTRRNYVEALRHSDGTPIYSARHEEVLTDGYPPLMKLGNTLFNHYTAFSSATGDPIGPHGLFADVYDDNQSAYAFAYVGRTLYTWAGYPYGSAPTVLVARRDTTPPLPFLATQPPDGAVVTTSTPTLSWEATRDNDGGTGLDHYEVWIDEERASPDLPAHFHFLTHRRPLPKGDIVGASVPSIRAGMFVKRSCVRST